VRPVGTLGILGLPGATASGSWLYDMPPVNYANYANYAKDPCAQGLSHLQAASLTVFVATLRDRLQPFRPQPIWGCTV